MTAGWDQPICERCWVALQVGWENGPRPGLTFRVPVRLSSPGTETCAWCGYPTWAGIYVRADPATVPYPAEADA